jgi:FlgN protein
MMNGLVEHLERQLASNRRLLQIVLAQGESIREQDVQGVLARLADVRVEMSKRAQIERERDALLGSAAQVLRVHADQVTLDMLLKLTPEPTATRVRALSAELKGLLAEIARIHRQNRVLIRQELLFLDHLMRVLSGAPQAGYTNIGHTTQTQPANLVDTRA